MQNFEQTCFANADELAAAAAAAWLEEVAAAQRAGRRQRVALSGGRITQKLFAAVVALQRGRGASLDGVEFFWADERCVPPTDAESNFRMADAWLFRPLGIAAEHIHRIRGELTPAVAAELAEQELRAAAPQLDLVFLGMGEDGHVASLFPGEPEAVRANPAGFRAVLNSPKPPPQRVTLGYAALAAARQVWVLASGAGKEGALRESLSPTGQTPLAWVLRGRANTRLFTDIR